MGRKERPLGRSTATARLIAATKTARLIGIGIKQWRRHTVGLITNIAPRSHRRASATMGVIRGQAVTTDRLPSTAVDTIARQMANNVRPLSPRGMGGPAQGHRINGIRRFCTSRRQSTPLDAPP